jgi:hypothetical protein
VALLLGAWRRSQNQGWTLAIVGTPGNALRVLELCGLTDILPLDST